MIMGIRMRKKCLKWVIFQFQMKSYNFINKENVRFTGVALQLFSVQKLMEQEQVGLPITMVNTAVEVKEEPFTPSPKKRKLNK